MSRVAEEIRRGEDARDDDEGARLQFLVESLQSLSDLSVVADDVLEALASRTGSGGMARGALLRFGNRAIAPLVRSISGETGTHTRFALGDLEALVRVTSVDRTLTPASQEAVGDLVRKILAEDVLTYLDIGATGSLAAATGDAELRAITVGLTDPAELTRRGVAASLQARVIQKIQNSLSTSPAR